MKKIVSKKHWIAYIGYVMVIVMALIIGIFFYSYHHKHPERIPNYMLYGAYVISFWWLYKGIRGILLLSQIKWTLDNNVLTIEFGVLPWRRTKFSTPTAHLFEAYTRKNVIGDILNYGSLFVKITDGAHSDFRVFYIRNPKKMVEAIHQSIVNAKGRTV